MVAANGNVKATEINDRQKRGIYRHKTFTYANYTSQNEKNEKKTELSFAETKTEYFYAHLAVPLLVAV